MNYGAGSIDFTGIAVANSSPVVLPGANEGVYYDSVGNFYQWGSPVFGDSTITVPRFISLDDGAGGDATMTLQGAGGSTWKFGHQGGNDIMELIMIQATSQSRYLWGDFIKSVNTQSGIFAEVWRVNGQSGDTFQILQDSNSGVQIKNLYPGTNPGQGNMAFQHVRIPGSDDGFYWLNQFGFLANLYPANFDGGTYFDLIGTDVNSPVMFSTQYSGGPGTLFKWGRGAAGEFTIMDAQSNNEIMTYDPLSNLVIFGNPNGLVQFTVLSPINTDQGTMSAPGYWRLGDIVAGAVTPDTTRSVQVEISGTLYNLIVAV